MARILLAEDHPDNRDILERRLTREGHDVVSACDGAEAVRFAKEHDPDLILMDLAMPVMGGLEALSVLRADARFANVPIVALTAHVMSDAKTECLEAGFNAFASKPIEFKALSALIVELLEKRRRI